jgi:hypothetical protein
MPGAMIEHAHPLNQNLRSGPLTEYVKHRHGNVYRELHVSTPEAQAWCDAVARLIEDVKRKHNVG